MLATLLPAALYGLVSGFNDGGNLMASFTAGRVISPRIAALLLLVTPLGPLVLGSGVARTISTDVIDLTDQGELGFALIALVSIVVVLLSWRLQVPTSMTLSLVGAMVGWALAGGQHARIHWSGVGRVLAAIPLSVIGGGVLSLLVFRLMRLLLGGLPHAQVLRIAQLQFGTAALQAFAYGANDMQKTIGLLVAGRSLSAAQQPPLSYGLALAVAFLTFALGTMLGGWRLAQRIGFGVVKARPAQALAEQLGAGVMVTLLAGAGAPVSTTQTLDGALVGVGVGWRASAIRWGIVSQMLTSWAVTLPLALALALVVHAAFRLAGLA